MNTLARAVLEAFIFEKKKLSIDEAKKIRLLADEKLPVFITIYDGESLVASVGRIYPKSETQTEELIENTVLLPLDPRFEPYMKNTELIRKLHFRVDTFRDTDRRLLHHPDELAADQEGMILLCQNQEKAGIILPHMNKEKVGGEEIYHELIRKINLDMTKIGKGDIILYGVKTEMFEDK